MLSLRFLWVCSFAVFGYCSPAAADGRQWHFEAPVNGELVGDAEVEPLGPTSKHYEGMPKENHALRLDGDGDYLRVADEGEESELDFDSGDPLTLEAWVQLDELASGRNVYLVGKGRTHQGEPRDNQNYALRLRGAGGEARVSFLFRSRPSANQPSAWHRWTSNEGFTAGGAWHHVAVSYRFGDPESIRGYVDGRRVSGKWDMGGATERPPVVDDDELWIGSALGGSPGNSLRGAIDHVAIHRRLVPAEHFAKQYQPIVHPPQSPPAGLPEGRVLVRLHENVGGHGSWPIQLPEPLLRYQQPSFAIPEIPVPYGPGGIRRDWSGPVMMQLMADVELPTGSSGAPRQWMLRAGGLARLWVDDKVVAETPPHLGPASAHGEVIRYESDDPWLRPPRPGHHERRTTHPTQDGSARITLEAIIGGENLRYEAGEILVATRTGDQQPWQVLSLGDPLPLTDRHWRPHARSLVRIVTELNDRQRREAAASEDEFWNRRHERGREYVEKLPEIDVPADASDSENPIDDFVAARWARAEDPPSPPPLTDDAAFLRRLYLDCVGVPPTVEEIEAFAALPGDSATRRSEAIDQVLEDPRWADHWTAYWLDVLAENPSVLKPTLNNTGPFRWYLYDVIRDNRAVDRWVTGLIRMEGSAGGGGPAGFGMASENDVPMAAKAHVLGTAFLGVNMKCARCHDAPYHDWKQGDLFSIAAMLKGEPIEIPESSSVPPSFFEGGIGGASLIEVSLEPGQEVPPAWPLGSEASDEALDPELLEHHEEPRERLAAHLTRPENQRFTRAVVNRVWKRLIGEGIVEPVNDWDGSSPSHPRLLDYLGRELTASGYDVQHVARMILNSQLYQRQAVDRPVEHSSDERLFAAPRLRRMTAEQIVDSMYSAVGRPMDVEELTFDPEARQRPNAMTNLGQPRRAWQLTSLSNERDRPSLSLPKAAAVTACLEAFGWTGSRQEPTDERAAKPNVIQPGMLAGGMLSIQLTRLTDRDSLTEACLGAASPQQLVDHLFQRFLTRSPTEREQARFQKLLTPGFENRVLDRPLETKPPIREPAVTWANHLSVEANEIRIRQSERLRRGPEPSRKLRPEWRERAEDAVWALINTPEFQFVP